MSINYRGLSIPFTQMGAVSSDDLFEPREQAIFDFYEANKSRYRNALDVGANIGVHTLLMSRQGWHVTAFEPDPSHYRLLILNVARNGMNGHVEAHNSALSTDNGFADFVRVLGNTTASHLAGSRTHHGAVEVIRVHTVDCRRFFAVSDFAKIDCEGSEADLLCCLRPAPRCDFLVEIGSRRNAERIFEHFVEHGIWVQACGWARTERMQDMPRHYTEGSVFISDEPPFQAHI